MAANTVLRECEQPARDVALAASRRVVDRWDSFRRLGKTQLPWELWLNGFIQDRNQGRDLNPPRRQVIVIHPQGGVEISHLGLNATRLDVLVVEFAGLLVYREDRANYSGGSLGVTVPTDGSLGYDAILYLRRAIKAGVVWHKAAAGRKASVNLLLTVDVYRLFQAGQ